MIHFVGAGPGAVDLITVRGLKLIQEADVIIYAGSLVNKDLLASAKENCEAHNSATMALEEIIGVMQTAESQNKITVRLHTGDPCLYGAIREQMDALDKLHIKDDYTPGVSSFCGAASSLCTEYTLPGVSQSVIITRIKGKTDVPDREDLAKFASHRATMVIFLSVGLIDKVQEELIKGGYEPKTPAAIVYKSTWPDEKVIRGTVSSLKEHCDKNKITHTALIIVGDVLQSTYEKSKLYDANFSTGFRKGSGE